MNWNGKRYWLVGASEGLGAALAHKMSRAGISLALSARNADKLSELANSLPGPATVHPLDITDRASLIAVADSLGDIDGVVHMAGAYWPMNATNWHADHAETMAQVNFVGALNLMGVVTPRFVARDQGHIVLTGSLAGYRGLPGAIGYAASKAGVMALAESMYSDLRKTGVRVQLVNPGFIRTRLTEKNDFSMPFIMTPEQAADAYFEHMCRDKFSCSFPSLFAAAFRAGRLLPDALYYRVFA